MPAISIGMPVYNGQKSLSNALTSILSQTFTDFELIISDNCSTDQTENICRQFAATDSRIKYTRQSSNIGGIANFKYVLDKATCDYFLWAACDDVRSSDYLELNYTFLSKNPDYVASTTPNRMDGSEKIVNFKLTGNTYERFIDFFDNCWVSHGIFYSLVRTNILRKCKILDQAFVAADWGIDLFLALNGKINRTEQGLTIFGSNGISSRPNPYRAFRNKKIEYLFPFYRLSIYVWGLINDFSFQEKLKIAFILLKLNLFANYDRVYARLYSVYFKYIRPKIRKPLDQKS